MNSSLQAAKNQPTVRLKGRISLLDDGELAVFASIKAGLNTGV
jgi:hypothetical protein